MYTVIITLIILFSQKLIETLFAKYIHQRMNGQNTHQNLNENFKTFLWQDIYFNVAFIVAMYVKRNNWINS